MFNRSSTTSPQALRAALIEAEAVKLRLMGHSYEEISRMLSAEFKTRITDRLAAAAVKRAIARSKAEASETLKESREIQSLQLDQLFYHAMLHVRAGDRQAIGDVVKVMDRKAKLMGLDAPQKIEAKVEGSNSQLSSLTPEQLDKIEEALNTGIATEQSGETDGFVDYNEEIEYPEEVGSAQDIGSNPDD